MVKKTKDLIKYSALCLWRPKLPIFSPVKGQLNPTHGTLRLIMSPANSIVFELFSPHLKMIWILILTGIKNFFAQIICLLNKKRVDLTHFSSKIRIFLNLDRVNFCKLSYYRIFYFIFIRTDLGEKLRFFKSFEEKSSFFLYSEQIVLLFAITVRI